MSFFNVFLPGGVPFIISPFLVGVEIISYLARVVSLAVRLFANMMSGHGLLKILAKFIYGMLPIFVGFDIIFLCFGLFIVFSVTLLETVIAFLQAYVFILLVIIYLNDVIHLH
jgi:ATP synthase subunit 6